MKLKKRIHHLVCALSHIDDLSVAPGGHEALSEALDMAQEVSLLAELVHEGDDDGLLVPIGITHQHD